MRKPPDIRGLIRTFLDPWKRRKDVLGALFCGSYAVGLESRFSDIDLYIILSDQASARERGDRIVEGYVVEYNADPIRYIQKLQKEQYEAGIRHCARKLATGKIIFDKNSAVRRLQREAKREMRKKFKRYDRIWVEMSKYYLWDQICDLRDLADQRHAGFAFAYYGGVQKILDFYGKYQGVEVPRPVRMYRFLSEPDFRRRYNIAPFPDGKFMRMAIWCFKTPSLKRIERLTKYVQEKMGGFSLDGWRLRVPLNPKSSLK